MTWPLLTRLRRAPVLSAPGTLLTERLYQDHHRVTLLPHKVCDNPSMDGFITIIDKEVVKFVVNTGIGKITRKRRSGENQISGKIRKVYWSGDSLIVIYDKNIIMK